MAQELEIAMALICQVDKYHLQLRDGDPRIGAVGKIGCFGGKVGVGEDDHRQTVSRELAEETNLVFRPDQFRYIDTVHTVSDFELKPVGIKAYVYEILLPQNLKVESTEGELVTWTREEIVQHQEQLTPASKEFFKGYF